TLQVGSWKTRSPSPSVFAALRRDKPGEGESSAKLYLLAGARRRTTSQAVSLASLPPMTRISPTGRDWVRLMRWLLQIRVTSKLESEWIFTSNCVFSLTATVRKAAGPTTKLVRLTSK